MQIDEKLLTKLEKLSALSITEKRAELMKDLSEIVNFVEKLNELELNSQKLTISTIKGGTPFRDDKISTSEVINDVLKNAPKTLDHFFVVPKIIE